MSVIVKSSSGELHIQLQRDVTSVHPLIIVFLIPGEYLLFCKGADSSIFPRVVSGKVEQVKARVEQNAVVSSRIL